MFCPRCKAEYRKGFYKCAECEVDLVYELPKQEKDMPQEEHSRPNGKLIAGKFIKLLQVDNAGEIAFLESILEATDIPYYFQSLAIRAISPAQVPANLMIEETRIEETKELLKDFVERK